MVLFLRNVQKRHLICDLNPDYKRENGLLTGYVLYPAKPSNLEECQCGVSFLCKNKIKTK